MSTAERALVLGGGGVAGVAWTVGLLTGLAEAGADVCDADLVVGTSAGAVVGALVATGVPCDEAFARQVDPARQSVERSSPVDMDEFVRRLAVAFDGASSAAEIRVRVGAMALETAAGAPEDRREVIASRLPVHDWPARRLLVTAVAAHTGERVVLSRESGVGLVDAVAASCAVPGVWPPVLLDGRPHVDGGVWSTLSTDLAVGCARVLVLAPMGVEGGGPLGPDLDEHRPALERAGRLLALEPNAASREAFGTNPLDPATRVPAATAGRAQAADVVDRVRALWQD